MSWIHVDKLEHAVVPTPPRKGGEGHGAEPLLVNKMLELPEGECVVFDARTTMDVKRIVHPMRYWLRRRGFRMCSKWDQGMLYLWRGEPVAGVEGKRARRAETPANEEAGCA